MPKHNKKRNIGIIYELMLRHISNCLVEGDMKGVKSATKILEKRFNKNTTLYREFRLFNALAKSNVSSTEIAAAILTEAKGAARRVDGVSLDREKSALIRDINYKVKDKRFYYRNIPQYKDYANIQNLINEWQKGDTSDLKKVVVLEKRVIDLLLREKKEKDVFVEKKNLESSDADRLVVKIMTEKINNKYGEMLSEQKEIIKNYALYGNGDNQERFTNFLKIQKRNSLKQLDLFERSNKNEFIANKICNVRKKIALLNENDMSDKSIIKFLTITKLVSELKEV
tara:strand:- start:317 stop:1168 length:852 start_codon:yes stop_codon:yes gene_type:complete